MRRRERSISSISRAHARALGSTVRSLQQSMCGIPSIPSPPSTPRWPPAASRPRPSMRRRHRDLPILLRRGLAGGTWLSDERKRRDEKRFCSSLSLSLSLRRKKKKKSASEKDRGAPRRRLSVDTLRFVFFRFRCSSSFLRHVEQEQQRQELPRRGTRERSRSLSRPLEAARAGSGRSLPERDKENGDKNDGLSVLPRFSLCCLRHSPNICPPLSGLSCS